jgi:hypothetical protein
VAAAAPTPDGKGFWTVTGSGQVSVEGDATFYGDASSLNLNGSIVSIAPTFDGRGYWLLGSDGGVFSYGDASFYGSTGNLHLNAPALRMAATSDGGGYWLVASDGGIFAFGDATFFGSTGSLSLNEPVVGMASTANSQGYWLVAADGGIFAFGSAPFYGSASGTADPGSVVSIVATGDGGGYWIIGDDGNIYPYGDAATTGGAAPPPVAALSPEFLGEITPVSSNNWSNPSDGTYEINGTTYTQSIATNMINYGIGHNGEGDIEYNVARQYTHLQATIGLSDQSSAGVPVRFQVLGDGTVLFQQDLTLGQSVPIDVDISGVLRLQLEVTELVTPDDFQPADAVFGSAQVTP